MMSDLQQNTTVEYANYTHNATIVTQGPPQTEEDMAADAIWILTSTFIIFTMQSGFGLLESGSVSTKNEANIMVKNAVDVIVGGLAFWMFGYAFAFGTGIYSNPFCGWGYFCVTVNKEDLGFIYSKFFFQASFATTATTIVSGAMAERTKLEAYMVFSFLNTLIFCFPAHWVWDQKGWLAQLGFVDIAGSGPVHMVGGLTGLVATLVLKPRHRRFDSKYAPQMGSPTNALLGMFMLWWGWLGFNCGSTFGISGFKWKLAARSAVATLNASAGGGWVGLTFRSAISTFIASTAGGIISLLTSYIFEKRKFDVCYLINGILGSLVGITALCALAEPWEGLVIGSVGALLALSFCKLEEKLHIDDPVGCVGVHAVSGTWGLLSVGLFAKQDRLKSAISLQKDLPGLFYGGGGYLLGIQLAGIAALASWTIVWAYILLKLVDLTIGLRVSVEHELLGADLVEHGVGDFDYDKTTNTMIGIKSDVMSNAELNMHYADSSQAEDLDTYVRGHISRRRISVVDLRHLRHMQSVTSDVSNLQANGSSNRGSICVEREQTTEPKSPTIDNIESNGITLRNFFSTKRRRRNYSLNKNNTNGGSQDIKTAGTVFGANQQRNVSNVHNSATMEYNNEAFNADITYPQSPRRESTFTQER